MHADIAEKRQDLIALCRRYGVKRLEVFGSAARGADFDPTRSDADFLVTFSPETRDDLSSLETSEKRGFDEVDGAPCQAGAANDAKRILSP